MSENIISFEVCERNTEHARLIMNWRNDPITLSMFYHRRPKIWPDFWEEYQNSYLSLSPPPVFAIHQEDKVGFLKFDPLLLQGNEGRAVSISINVSPDHRSKGLGTEILVAANDHLRKCEIDYVCAEIRKENKASCRAFEKAGYEYQNEAIVKIEDIGEEAPVFKYLKKLI